MQSSYAEAISRLLRDEGGYGNDPRDPGGPTNFGITLADARRFWKADATALDVKNMHISVARDIYATKYWAAMRCPELPPGVDYAVFDYGVNSGTGRAGKVLRRCLGFPDNSSVITTAIVVTANSVDRAKLVEDICAERLRFLKSLPTWPHFGPGWGRRVAGVEAAGKRMAVAPGVPVTPESNPTIIGSPAKGVVPVNKKAQTATTGAVATAGGATAVSQSHNITIVLLVIGVTLVVAVGVWFFFHWLQKRQQETKA